LGVVWFDAHGDFNTPETTTSGFLDGMALATLCGRCWTRLTGTIPGFVPVGERAVALVGVRDLDAAEAALLDNSDITVIAARQLKEGVTHFFNFECPITSAYVHIDLDVLDPSQGRANQYAMPGGLSVPDLVWALESVAQHVSIAAAAVTAYDPTADLGGNIVDQARHIVSMLVRHVTQQRSA
jgi:arginase